MEAAGDTARRREPKPATLTLKDLVTASPEMERVINSAFSSRWIKNIGSGVASATSQVINEAEPSLCEFKPFVHYDEPMGGHCVIRIHTHDNGDVFIRRLDKAGLKYEIDGFAYEGHQSITVEGFKGVTVIIPSTFFLPHELVAAA